MPLVQRCETWDTAATGMCQAGLHAADLHAQQHTVYARRLIPDIKACEAVAQCSSADKNTAACNAPT